uniref:GUN4 domain-containing protein n=1 Tax=Cylindrospermopsis raciborskii TaxID=77022 RepID=UPI0013655721
LGGIQGVRTYYNDPDPKHRIIILQQALKYGDEGSEFLLEVLKKDDSYEVKDAAYNLLSSKDSELAKSSGYIPQIFLKLDSLLKSQNFREADLETDKVILAVANREREGWLRIEDAEKFPCKELRSIDQLWLKYSRGKFGISVQQQIYQSLGGTKYLDYDVWCKMGDRVGWRKGGKWLSYSDLNFSQQAPSGHLPHLVFSLTDFGGGWRYFPPLKWVFPSCPDMQSVTYKNFQRS